MHLDRLAGLGLSIALTACSSGKIPFEEIEDAGDVEDACEEYEDQVEDETIEIVFPAATDVCAWGSGDNGSPVEGFYTARVEQTQSLDLDEVVLCDIDMDMTGLVPDQVQIMEFDDHFFFTFNDVVLAASNEVSVSYLETDDDLPLYSWDAVAFTEFDNQQAPFCLGEAEGDAECDIPDTETSGPISLSYGEDIITELSIRAFDDDRYDYGFVVTGDDNADTDCMHAEFGFTVEVEYLEED